MDVSPRGSQQSQFDSAKGPLCRAQEAPTDATYRAAECEATVYLVTAETPSWVGAPGIKCVTLQRDSHLSACASDGPSAVVIDAALLRLPDRDWIESIGNTFGRVIAVSRTPQEAQNARMSGVSSTFPPDFLSLPDDLAATMLTELARETNRVPESLEGFMRDAIHEFRTPLSVIIEFASLCQDGIGGQLTPKQGDLIDGVMEAADQLCEHFDDYRDSVRMQLGSLPAKDDVTSLESIVLRATTESGVQVALNELLTNGSVVSSIDSVHLSKAIRRVIAAAAERTRSDAPIRIGIQPSPAQERLHEVSIEFEGLEPSNNDMTVFAESNMESGTGNSRGVARAFGLGVSMAKPFLEGSGGAIRIEPRQNVGGRFVLTLPTAPVARFAMALK